MKNSVFNFTISLFLSLFFALNIFGQTENPVKTEKEIKAEQKKQDEAEKRRLKEEEKSQKKLREETIQKMTVDMEYMAKFPQDFVGKRWYARALFGELSPFTFENQSIYFLKVKGKDAEFSNYLANNEITFSVTEELAKELFIYFRKYKAETSIDGFYPGRTFFELAKFNINGSTFFVARIECIEFTSIMGIKFKTIGKCPY